MSCAATTALGSTDIMTSPILLATAVAIIATFLQIGWLFFRKRPIDKMLWVSFAIVTIFGGATIYFRNPIFIQWKPTILYWLFAIIFLSIKITSGKVCCAGYIGSSVHVTGTALGKLNTGWMLFFVLMGIANLIAMNFLLQRMG